MKLIKTDLYLLWVDDKSQGEVGDWGVTKTWGENTKPFRLTAEHVRVYDPMFKQVVAHLPLKDAPTLKGVLLLPPLYFLIEGYKTLPKQYSEEDMKKAYIEGTNEGARHERIVNDEDWDSLALLQNLPEDAGFKMFMQSLSPAIYPVVFEPSTRKCGDDDGCDLSERTGGDRECFKECEGKWVTIQTKDGEQIIGAYKF